ncbi:MAG: cohesin domain-containing protein [Methanosarcinales archaeon]|nr:cohesin domain-containing protein [Methanosarcinales archaeon]
MNINYLFGVGILLAAMLVFAAPAAADNVIYFDPDPSCIEPGESIVVTMYVNNSDPVQNWQDDIYFDPTVVNITGYTCGEFPLGCQMSHWGDHVRRGGVTGDGTNLEPGIHELGNLTLEGISQGTSTLEHQGNVIGNWYGQPLPDQVWIDGTFNCPCTAPTYTISGYTDPAADTVKITNLDKSGIVDERPADYIDPATGFYNLTLDVPGDAEQDDVLRITACQGLDESNCNVINHTVVNAPGEDVNVNLTLNHYCLDLPEFPMYEAEEVGDPADHNKGCGPAVAKMWLDYMHNSTTQWDDTHFGDMPAMNQAQLYDWGIGNNSNTNLPYFDTEGMWYTVQHLDPEPYSEYGYNFGKYSSTDQDYMVMQICKWLSYAPGKKPGHPVHVPGAVPAYGNYENWMAVRGIHTSEDAYPLPADLLVYGFWVNDPYPASLGGIGENSYKTIAEWNSAYYLPLDVPGDTYDGKYVGILEPPGDDDGEITIVPAKPRFADAITPVLTEKSLMMYNIEEPVLEMKVNDDESLKIVKAATDGVTEELVPYDIGFAEVFAKTAPGTPKFVLSDNGDYYLVPFNVAIEKPLIKKGPVEIEKVKISGFERPGHVERVDEKIIAKPIPIEPTKLESTVVVVLVDAEDGSFKEASWVADPVKYLPVSKVEALKLALGEMSITDSSELRALKSKPAIELAYQSKSPYYPAWKVTIGDAITFVNQDGTVSS